ncbi:ureide permease 1-like isoform X2 [Panicum virgatum]|uniref:ureide permease 1-like isoform X2 n=1 Tax=Panicum virgatum TaxID=38727 RepID=UPI0019D57685|nr:ureide permease 1-like isoform X2 [Panicum virgatum]
MYIVENKGGAIALILFAILCGGSFAPAMSFMERRGRLPQHIYLDYSIANFLVAVLIAFTFGQIGPGKVGMPNFFTQLSQDNWPSVLVAMAGGLALSLGNMICQYAWAFVGLSLVNIIVCCMIVDLGTTVNYFLDGRINRAEFLFPGVACFMVAVVLSSILHSSNAKDKKEKLSSLGVDFSANQISRDLEISKDSDAEGSNTAPNLAKPGTAEFLAQIEKRRSIKAAGTSTTRGLAVVLFAGLCFFVFSPAFNLATNDQWHLLKKGVPHLVVYTAFFYFYLSGFVIAVCVNIWLLYRPIASVPASTMEAYLRDWNGRHWALLSSLLCGFCNDFQFMGGQAAVFATADAVMASPLICTIWDIILFGEYRRSSRKTYFLLTSMLTLFVIAIGVLLASAGHRKTA